VLHLINQPDIPKTAMNENIKIVKTWLVSGN